MNALKMALELEALKQTMLAAACDAICPYKVGEIVATRVGLYCLPDKDKRSGSVRIVDRWIEADHKELKLVVIYNKMEGGAGFVGTWTSSNCPELTKAMDEAIKNVPKELLPQKYRL
jgi:hypothetical protein